jgi:TetR/AcrR family fatty acid metabolism transcriptional regulator
MQVAHRTRGEECRARLLAAAAHEFAVHGYHETRVSTIVADAGVSQPTFYFYFPSKEAIFAELVNSFCQRFHALAEDVPLCQGHPLPYVIAQMQVKMEATFQLFAEDPNITRISLFQAPGAEQIKQEIAERFHHRLRMMQESGYIRSDIPIDVMTNYMSGVMERLTERYLFTRKSDPQSLARQVAELIFNGIRTERAASFLAEEDDIEVL